MENSNLLDGIALESLDSAHRMDELKIPMLVKSDDEDTIFDKKKPCEKSQDKNMKAINVILILFGLFSIAFIVRSEQFVMMMLM